MEVLTGIITDAEVVNSAQVVIDSKLPDTEVEVSKSITAEVSPQNYVLSTGGMYGAGFTGAAPTWLLDAIQQELSTGTGNVMSVLAGIQTVLDSLTLGVNQNIAQIESTILSQSSLATSVQSQINANEASILNVAATRVTPTEAQTIALQVQQSTFGLDATAFIGSIASTYVGVGSAIAQDINLISAELNGINVSISTLDTINITQNATISQLQTDTGISIADLQAQLDKSIDTWFYNEAPTLLNAPAVGWTTVTDKKTHNGDLYYNKTTGLAYSYSYVNSTESWISVTEPTIVNSLKELSLREDTLDGKRSVYYTATEPAPKAEDGVTAIAIETGDLWISSTTSITKVRSSGGVWVDITNTATENAIIDLSVLEETNDGVVATFYQTTAPTSGMSYGDWWVDTDAIPMVAYRYQDSNGKNVGTVSWYNESTSIIGKSIIDSDTAKRQATNIENGTTQINLSTYINTPWEAELNTWITNVFTPFQDDMYSQIDSVIETHFGEVVPTLGNLPASAWTTTLLKDAHLGDLYYDSISGIGYRFLLVGGVYSWGVISDSGVAAALQAASDAQDTADGKRRVFISSWNGTAWTAVLPIAPYDRGDIFTPLVDTISGAVTYYKGEMYVCNISKTLGTAFANGDFVSATNYKYIEGLVSTLDGELGSLQNLTDLKIESYYQAAIPHQEVSLPKIDVLVPTYDTYIKDVWYSTTSENKTYIYKREDNELYADDNGLVGDTAGTNETNGLVSGEVLLLEEDLGNLLGIDGTYDNKYYYRWVETPVPTEVFDQIDSKKTIYVSQPTAYNARDILIPNVSFTVEGLVFNANEIYIAQSNSTVFNKLHWIKATKYTDDTRVQNVLDGLEQIDLSQHVNSLGWVTQTNLNAITTNIGLDIATVDGKINAEEIARITAVATEASVRSAAISARILEEARLDGVITAEEQARIDAINVVDAAYKEYNRIVTLAIADGVLTPTEEALIANAAVEVAAAKQRFVDVETMASTTDGLLDTFLTVTYVDDIGGIQTQIDGKSVSWFQESEPFNPATGTVAQNGDIWFKTSTKELRVYVYSTLTWNLVTDPKAIEAYNAASTAQNTADGKIQNYVVEPTTPYYVGDTWMQGSTGDIYVCDTEKLTGLFLQSDWSIASKYTDDTTATTAMNNAATADGKAVDALNKLSDIASDDKLTPSEKQKVKLEWDLIVTEVPKVLANATSAGILVTDALYLAYSNVASPYGKYQLLSTYITPLLVDLNITSTIVGTTFRSTFKAYYDAKIELLLAISIKLKDKADAAQAKADGIANGTVAINLAAATVGGVALTTYVAGELDKEVVILSGTATPTTSPTTPTGKLNDIYIQKGTATGTSGVVVDVVNTWKHNGTIWEAIGSNSNLTALADLTDGKRTIYSNEGITTPSTGVNLNDLWIPSSNSTDGTTYLKDEIYIYKVAGWVKATKYTDDSAVNRILDGTTSIANAKIGTTTIGTYVSDAVATGTDNMVHVYSGSETQKPLTATLGDLYIETHSTTAVVTSYRWNSTTWVEVEGASNVKALQDLTDGKRTIYTTSGIPTNTDATGDLNVAIRDLWIPPATVTISTITYRKGEIYICNSVSPITFVVATEYYSLISNVQTQVDSKVDTYYQGTVPYANQTNVPKDIRSGDYWYCTVNVSTYIKGNIYKYVETVNGSNFDYTWTLSADVTKSAFDQIDGKKTIFGGATVPTAIAVNDVWIPNGYVGTTYTNGFMYQWNGTVWADTVTYTDDTVANTKPNVYSQPTAPSSVGRILGDLWVDTDDMNHLYRWNGSIWSDIRDGTIAEASGSASAALTAASNAMTAAQTAQATADGAIRTWYQSLAPTGLNATTDIGDMWFDTDDNQAYRWSGTVWVIIEDNSIAVALQAAQTAQTTADGKITSFYQDSAPIIGMSTGDLWYNTVDKNKPYYYSGTAWVVLRDGTIADAQTTADTKSMVLYTSTIPTLLTHPLLDVGDQWVNTSTSELRVWNGTAWTTTTNDTANKAYVIANTEKHLYNSINASTPVPISPIVLGSGDLWVVTDKWYVNEIDSTSNTTETIYGNLVRRYNSVLEVWEDMTNTEAKNSSLKWSATSSKFITDPYGKITGWKISDSSSAPSNMVVNADYFSLEDDAGNNAVMTSDGLAFYKSGIVEPFKMVAKIQTGTATNGSVVNLEGFYKSTPIVFVSQNEVKSYDANYSNQTQKWQIRAESLAGSTATGIWSFSAIARLILDASNSSSSLAYSYSGTTDTIYSSVFTTPNNTTAITASGTINSYRTTGVAGSYQKRLCVCTLQTSPDSSTWTDQSQQVITHGADLSSDLFTISKTGLVSSLWYYRVKFVWTDDVGTFTTSIGYDYFTRTVTPANWNYDVEVGVYITDAGISARNTTLSVSYTPTTGEEILSGNFSYSWNCTVTPDSSANGTDTGAYGRLYSTSPTTTAYLQYAPSSGGAMQGSFSSSKSISTVDNTQQIIANVYRSSVNNIPVGYIRTAGTVSNINLTLYTRIPQSSTTTPTNTIGAMSASFTLSTTTILDATGTLNYMAISY